MVKIKDMNKLQLIGLLHDLRVEDVKMHDGDIKYNNILVGSSDDDTQLDEETAMQLSKLYKLDVVMANVCSERNNLYSVEDYEKYDYECFVTIGLMDKK